MTIYAVIVTKETVAMVQAADAGEAKAIARRNVNEILRECPTDATVDSHGVISTQAELAPFGWDAQCLPYGGDGNTRLGAILPKESA